MKKLPKKSKLCPVWKQRLLLIIYLIIGANIIALVINEILILIVKFNSTLLKSNQH